MRTRTKHIPIFDAKVGMTLASSISLTNHGQLSLKLNQGHTLSIASIEQLIAHGAEYIAIVEADRRSETQVAIDNSAAIQRVNEIFAGVEMRDPNINALVKQVLRYRTTR